MRVETVMFAPTTDQYSGRVPKPIQAAEIAAAAREVEELGFDGGTSPEAGHDAFLPLAIAAEHTRRIRLGTNVAIAFPRSPMVTAQMAWDLQAFSNGRFRLGLGSQVKAHVERRYGTPWTGGPGPRLREYLLCLRAIWKSFQDGEKPSWFKGEHYQFTLLSPFFSPGPIEHPHVPIDLAAVNPYMARLAGELADGLRLHPISTFRHTAQVIVPAIAEGAKKAGRDPAEFDLILTPFLATGSDARELEKAKRATKQRIAFYASTPTYHSVLAFHGWQELGERLHRMTREGKWAQLGDEIPDGALAAWAIVATWDQLAAQVVERCRSAGAPTVMLDLPPALRAAKGPLREIVRAIQKG